MSLWCELYPSGGCSPAYRTPTHITGIESKSVDLSFWDNSARADMLCSSGMESNAAMQRCDRDAIDSVCTQSVQWSSLAVGSKNPIPTFRVARGVGPIELGALGAKDDNRRDVTGWTGYNAKGTRTPPFSNGAECRECCRGGRGRSCEQTEGGERALRTWTAGQIRRRRAEIRHHMYLREEVLGVPCGAAHAMLTPREHCYLAAQSTDTFAGEQRGGLHAVLSITARWVACSGLIGSGSEASEIL